MESEFSQSRSYVTTRDIITCKYFFPRILSILSLDNVVGIATCPIICCKIHFKIFQNIFLKLGFGQCKDEQPLQSMDLQGKEEKDKTHTGKLFKKNVRKAIKVSWVRHFWNSNKKNCVGDLINFPR